MFGDSQSANLDRKKNPREDANFLSIITFYFTYKIFKKGFKKELDEDDIYDTVKSYRSSKLGDKLENEWRKEYSEKDPSLFRTLLRVFGREYMIYGLIQLVIRTSLMTIRILLLEHFLSYFSPESEQNRMTKNQAVWYAFVLILSIFAHTIYNNTYMLCLQQMAMKIRIALCSVIYRKTLTLSSVDIDEISVGKIVTLISKDVREFENLILFVHDAWIGVIHIFILTYLMYVEIGIAAACGVATLLLFLPFQLWFGRITTKMRLKTAMKTDSRLKLIQEILSSIHIIKMHAWEKYFSKLVADCRRSEINNLRIVFYLKSIILSIGEISTKVSFCVCIMICLKLREYITPQQIYVINVCFSTIRPITTSAIPTIISSAAEIKSSLKRIESLLLNKEMIFKNNMEVVSTKEPYIEMKSVSYGMNKNQPLVRGVSLKLEKSLIGVVGPVGSGKSALLKLFIQDMLPNYGHLKVNGSVSYVSQEPWLFPGTIRQNILFGHPFLKRRYDIVINICALRKDLNNLPNGDNTVINDKGLCLSKGQQARINLARALYKESDIYLLDNTLSVLDSNVGKIIFRNCVKGYLSDKICLLITNKIEYLQEVDTILLVKNGKIEKLDSHEVKKSEVNKYVKYDGEIMVDEYIPKESKDDEDEDDADETTNLFAGSPKGDVHENIYHETKKEGKVNIEVYKTYFRCAGYFCMCLLVLAYILSQVGNTAYHIFIKKWSDTVENSLRNNITNATLNGHGPNRKSGIPIVFILVIIICVITVTMLAKYLYLFYLTSKVSRKLHKMSLTNIISAHMEFFDSNLLGNILNRFSKDFGTIDEYIPLILEVLLQNFFLFLGLFYIMAKLSLILFSLTCVLGILSYIVAKLYLPTSRSLKRLDGITRSPVVGHLKTSLEGVITVKASGLQEDLKSHFDKHQDLHSSSEYMYITADRAFAFFVDLLCSIYISSIIACCIWVLKDPTTATVGLAISQAFGITKYIQWTVRQWAGLENQMTSVERVLEYAEIKKERNVGKEMENWPSEGKIGYKNIYLRYPKTNQLVLKNITFEVNPRERICIIGRTGAGKTSIISTLFRLYDPESGRIFIDNCDIKTVKLTSLRSKMSIIPQNPALFSGTIRSNLDPMNIYSDSDLLKALENVNIKSTTSEVFNLDCTITGGGTNLSSGQRQLICLARALVGNYKILVLDEATSDVDSNMNELIDNVIKSKFSSCTILTIVHQLSSVLAYDKVMIVNDGCIIEYNDPNILINDESSTFYKIMSKEGLKSS